MLTQPTDLPALTLCAERAGMALGCTFSNSAEYEAALIAKRRAAGMYGPPRRRGRRLLVATAVLLLALFFVI